MVSYNYTRDLITSGVNINLWDIDNPNRVDGGSAQIHLAKEIASAIPTKSLCCPCITCSSSNCQIDFMSALTSAEVATLTTTVNNHKNNV